jgi:hypothetical protein
MAAVWIETGELLFLAHIVSPVAAVVVVVAAAAAAAAAPAVVVVVVAVVVVAAAVVAVAVAAGAGAGAGAVAAAAGHNGPVSALAVVSAASTLVRDAHPCLYEQIRAPTKITCIACAELGC